MKKFVPSDEILSKYADVLINFALNSGQGIKKGETVVLEVPEVAKPLLKHLYRTVISAGANAIINYLPSGLSRDFYELASEEQINYFPKHYLKGKIKQIDHQLFILAETNLHELEGVDPKLIMSSRKSQKKYRDWCDKNEMDNKFTWTIGLYATKAAAKEANLTLEDYWQQIISACFLDDNNPVKRWQEVFTESSRIQETLTKLPIKSLHIESKNTSLDIGIGQNRCWVGGSGRNIPSFEIFTSPDWREVNGHIYFDQPLYRYGQIIKDISLEFKNGKVIKATASQGQDTLLEMIKVKNADKIGEFSLTDKRFSRISKFMAETLFDENFGGEYGNTHLALGASFKECYKGDLINKKQYKELGFNDSAIHTDIISTSNRVVTATLKDGSKKIIYSDGQFNI